MLIQTFFNHTLLTLNLPPGTTTEFVPSDDLPGGIYFLQILADERVLAVQKLVKL